MVHRAIVLASSVLLAFIVAGCQSTAATPLNPVSVSPSTLPSPTQIVATPSPSLSLSSTMMVTGTIDLEVTPICPTDDETPPCVGTPDVRFVVVDERGKVVGTREGTGTIDVTVPVSGVWSHRPVSSDSPVGLVTIFAYAPH